VHGVIQYFLSLLLLYEYQDYLRNCRFIRLISLFSAILWDYVYIEAALKFLSIVLNYGNKAGRGVYTGNPFDTITTLFLGYNCLIHIGFFPVNTIIIFKEFMVSYMNFRGTNKRDMEGAQLGAWDLFLIFKAMFKMLNPFWWFSDEDWIYE
jgi:hypothetical protein